ncbi:MAG: polysaccharide biosynthesis tyrosine autokinase [Prevotellaceae bacterium]|jgi:capsular exopolysaccharide synthesis family protein|nr:polysaccharide biosynthesis tyrosine autokinase [Prevotellaceae bacterium]
MEQYDNNNYNNNNNNTLPDNTEEESASIVEVVREYARHWRWFAVSAAICLIIAGCYIFTAQRQYRTALSILINVERRSNVNVEDLSSALGMVASTNNLDNEIVILQSPDLMCAVVDTLNLQSSYFVKQRLRTIELYNKTPLSAALAGNDTISTANFYVKKNRNGFTVKGTYFILGNQIEFSKEIKNISEPIPLSNGTYIVLQLTGQPMEEGEKYYVQMRSTLYAAYSLVSRLSVEQTTKMASVLRISLEGSNAGKNAAVLAELVRQYNQMNINIKNEIAYNTAVFINERLKEIAVELGDAESSVVSYKQQHSITDLSTEAQLYVQQSGQNEQKLLDLETQLNVLAEIERFATTPSNHSSVIPNIGITDVSLSAVINDYNTKLLTSNVQMKGMTEENPAYIKAKQTVDNMRNSIIDALQTLKQSYKVRKQDLVKQMAQTRARVISVPQQEMGLLEKSREQQIKQNLFLFLMQKREETNLSIASTPNKARVVISPIERNAPVAPRKNVILLAALLIGLFIPFAVIYVMNLMRTQIRNRHDIEKLSSVSVIGQIAKNQTDTNIVIESTKITAIAEMFRSLRNNLNFIFKNHQNQIISVTSTTKAEGKTFVSANLAVSFAISGKKILLIGSDVRNPKLKEYFSFTNNLGLSNYLANEDDWHLYLNRFESNSNLHIIHAGTVPPNPNELLMSEYLKKLVDEARQEYDFVIFDCAPVGLVSDGYLVAAFADLTLYVVRESVTPKDSIYFINSQRAEGKLKNMYIVLNGSSLDGNYKYGYGKEYGYNAPAKQV